MTDNLLAVLTPVAGAALAIGFVYWQSWRDGVLPDRKPRDRK